MQNYGHPVLDVICSFPALLDLMQFAFVSISQTCHLLQTKLEALNSCHDDHVVSRRDVASLYLAQMQKITTDMIDPFPG